MMTVWAVLGGFVLDALFGDEALDIATDITVLEQMLAGEGLSGPDFETKPE